MSATYKHFKNHIILIVSVNRTALPSCWCVRRLPDSHSDQPRTHIGSVWFTLINWLLTSWEAEDGREASKRGGCNLIFRLWKMREEQHVTHQGRVFPYKPSGCSRTEEADRAAAATAPSCRRPSTCQQQQNNVNDAWDRALTGSNMWQLGVSDLKASRTMRQHYIESCC